MLALALPAHQFGLFLQDDLAAAHDVVMSTQQGGSRQASSTGCTGTSHALDAVRVCACLATLTQVSLLQVAAKAVCLPAHTWMLVLPSAEG